MRTDIEISEAADVKPIVEIAASMGLGEGDLQMYGPNVAKVKLDSIAKDPKGKLILVTAITATPAGEGKTVTTIGLIQGLSMLGKKVVGALREPSLGPTFGIKGGATGGGMSQVYPMWDINLHFTGDIHAVGSAHNLLSAMVENHVAKGNALGIDPTRIAFNKAMDMNCRELRHIVVGLGGRTMGGVPRESTFVITSASEISAILALASDIEDLRARLNRIVVGYTYDGKAVTAEDIGCVGAMMVLLKDAIMPNLVQTLEGQPVFIHGFPFANIAHGNNSVIATRAAMAHGDYAVTEAGFAADLGAEKFMDIVCRQAGFSPDCVVIVASVRALMVHGGASLSDESTMGIEALEKGFCNLDKHISNLRAYGVPVVVAINRFARDTEAQLAVVRGHCDALGVPVAESDVFEEGGAGGIQLAEAVLEALERGKDFSYLYPLDIPIKEKIERIALSVYGARSVTYVPSVERALVEMQEAGYGDLPVCIAKTQASISDDPSKKGAPTGWDMIVRDVTLSAGAGFIVPICGRMTLMPGLPQKPAALDMDLGSDGRVKGIK